MPQFSLAQDIERKRLLDVCKSHSGEYRPAHHGSGSWATTYSDDFIEAAAELWQISQTAGLLYPQFQMSKDFKASGISTCRYSDFSVQRVEYLYKAHLKKRLEATGSNHSVV